MDSSGAGSSWVNGNGFGTGLNDGLKSSGIGALSGGAIGGIVGGIDAVCNGRDFWDGAIVVDIPIKEYNLPKIGQKEIAIILESILVVEVIRMVVLDY